MSDVSSKNMLKNLNLLFNAKSIAVIGASRKKGSVGQGILVSLLKGGVFDSKFNRKFSGKLYAINPKASLASMNMR